MEEIEISFHLFLPLLQTSILTLNESWAFFFKVQNQIMTISVFTGEIRVGLRYTAVSTSKYKLCVLTSFLFIIMIYHSILR